MLLPVSIHVDGSPCQGMRHSNFSFLPLQKQPSTLGRGTGKTLRKTLSPISTASSSSGKSRSRTRKLAGEGDEDDDEDLGELWWQKHRTQEV